ncbi:uncharacterized protein [Nicotiana sylvestris]|uniref:uncharacterized protein n=1 Tax=Nicotiana sylvestris TaxID=4096 RepID=UPI00388C860D
MTEVCSFLGLVGNYRRFVEEFSSLSAALTKLTQKVAKFQWSDACDWSFQALKDRLSLAPVLTLLEGTDGYVIYCDASSVGLGCEMMQHEKLNLQLIFGGPSKKDWGLRSPIGWFDVGEATLVGPELVQQAIEKIKLIQERLLAAQSRQKSYVYNRWREEFQVDDWVFQKVSPMKGIMRFGKRGKLSLRYIGPYRIIRKVGQVAYELDLPSDLESVHLVFHVSMLRKCIGDPSRVVSVGDIHVTEQLSYEETPIVILDRQVRRLRTKDVASVKVLCRNNNLEEMTCEAKEDMKSRYPYLFPPPAKGPTETS